MKSPLKYSILIMILSVMLCSCDYLDLSGFFASSPVDERFRAKNDLRDFSTPPVSDENTFNFLVIADTHYRNTRLNYFKTIEKKMPLLDISFIIVAGDITQSGLASSFTLARDEFTDIHVPVYPLIGNHDLYNNGFSHYKKTFGRTVYDFTIGNNYFIFIDTANGTLGSLQKTWLEKKLKKHKRDHIFIFSHYGIQDKELQSYVEWSVPEEKYYLINLCDTYNVDYFICGHFHDNDYAKIRGVNYVTVRNIKKGAKNIYLKISVTNGKVTHAYVD